MRVRARDLRSGSVLGGSVGRLLHRGVEADRTIAPSPGRMHRAWQAGVRDDSRWLGVGVLALAVAVVVHDMSTPSPEPALAGELGAALRAALAEPTAIGSSAWPLVGRALRWAAASAALVLGVVVVVAAVTGTLGPTDRAQRRALHVGRVRVRGAVLIAIAALALGTIAGRLVGVVAAGSRAVHASPAGLLALWHGWCVRALAVAGAVLVVAGVLELWLVRRQRIQALYQSVAQAREDLRQRGGRRA
jgi:hypothetical protein